MKRFSTWAAGMVLLLALFAPSRSASAQGFVVVVNEAGPRTMSKDDVSRIFLKKNKSMVPVDQDKASSVRAAFSQSVLGRPLSAIVSYWQQQIFSGGDSPPVEKDSDSEVLTFVRGNAKAIGYVSASAALGAGVHAVTIQ